MGFQMPTIRNWNLLNPELLPSAAGADERKERVLESEPDPNI